MKQQVNPVVMAVCIGVVLAIALFFGIRALSPAAPSDGPAPAAAGKATAPPVPGAADSQAGPEPATKMARPAEINGHAVPKNVPYDYMQKPVQGGNQ